MSTGIRTVGVYVCSNFGEMHAEREHLVRKVFPELRKTLAEHRVQLVDMDPCWDEPEELGTDCRFLQHCLQQIEHCRPFFIGLIGERYGSGPSSIPEEIFKKNEWLRPHSGKSLLELQILHGALNPKKGEARALLCLRDPGVLKDLPKDVRLRHYAELDTEKASKLADLKQRIRASGCTVVEPYSAKWSPDRVDRIRKVNGSFSDLEQFGIAVRDWLLKGIRSELDLPEKPAGETEADRLAAERHYQVKFIEPRLRSFAGRDGLVDNLLNFIEDQEGGLFLVKGPAGSGKSSLLARVLAAYRKKAPEGWVLPHFIGVTPESCSLRGMLRTLCLGMKGYLGPKDDVPDDPRQLMGAFKAWLRSVPEGRRLVLIIDGLDQLDEAYYARELRWLPEKLPQNVKVILSLTVGARAAETVMETLQVRGNRLMEMPALPGQERLAALKKHLSSSIRLLTTQQATALLQNAATGNPLFLTVALKELASSGSGGSVEERIDALPREGEALTALFGQIVERQVRKYGPELVQTVLLSLAHSRHGLREEDLVGLTKGLKAADDLFVLLHDLRPHLHYRGDIVETACQSLFDAAVARFAGTSRLRMDWYRKLAIHFEDLSYSDPRTLEDLPWVLVQNEEQERLEEVLCDLKFIQAKCQAGMLTGLLADYQLALERWPDYTFYDPFMPPGARPGRPSAAKPFKVSSEESEVGVAETLGSVVDLLLALPDDRREIQAGKPVCNSENPIPDRHFGQDLGISERLKQIHHLQKASSEGRDLHLKEVGPERVHAFANFVYACREDLTRHPSQTAMLARNRGMGCPVARQGESLTNGLTGCWISRDPRPRSPALYPACARVLEEHTAAVNCTAASPDGTRALSGSSDMVLRLWDLASGMSLLRLEEHEGSISSVALTSQAQFAVSAGADNTIRVWNLESGKCFKTLKEPSQQLLGLAASADGKRVVSFAGDHCLKIWDVEAGQVLHTIGVLESPATAVAMTADGKMALSAGQNGRVHAWAADSGKLLLTLRKHERPIRSVAVTPDGKLGIAGCQDGTLSVWDMARGNLLQMLEGHPAPVASVAASPDGRIVLSGSADGTIRVWDVASGQTVQVLHGHTDVVNCVSVTPDARLAVSAGGDDALRVWDLAEGQAFELPTDRWSGAPSAVSPDQKSVVSPAEDNSLRFWDTSTGQTIRRLEGHKEPVRSVIFTPDGSTAVSAGKDFTVRIWDLVAGQSHLTLEGHTESVNSLGVTPDCKLVVSASSDSTLRTWELKTGKAMKVFEGHHGSIHCVALTPDGKTAVSASDDNTLKVWDLADGKLLRSLEGHTFPVRGVSVTPDGKTAVSASWDRTVCAWDIQSGRRLALYLPQALMEAVSEIKPDGTFAVGSMDGHMHFLKLQNLKQEAPIVTGAFRLEFDTKGLGKQMASVFKRVLHTESPQDRQTPAFGPGQKMGGHYAKVPTFTCPWCGEQSPVPDEPRKIIQGNIRDVENMRKFVAAPSPCLFLPKETFDEPKLAILCPACRKSLRLNPFFADTRS